ncbi:MAG: TRAM domain-containing protein [Phycisphaerae bacterium]|nr:TRAM domain-containing protein [Phycisphaerae bacterium]
MSYAESGTLLAESRLYLILGALALAVVVVTIDLLIPRKSLEALAGLFFGLVAGLLITYVLALVLNLLLSAFIPEKLTKEPIYQVTEKTLVTPDGKVKLDEEGRPIIERSKVRIGEKDQPGVSITKVLLGIVCCYFCVSFITQTKDDIRFVIPYVEFAKQVKGQHPLILDTSVIIDGRIADICETGILDQKLIVPRFVLRELHAVADSNDKLKRARGRRGLDILHKLQTAENIDIQVIEARLAQAEAAESVDLKLLALAQQLNGHVATNDYNLNKVAKLRGVKIININDLANAMKPVVLPGEAMSVKIIKPGEEPGQGIGYLDDGTMVVVEHGRDRIGDTVDVSVTSVLQTSAGRMIFGRLEGAAPTSHHRRHSGQRQA